MFKNWKEKWAAKKAADERIANDDYLKRLRNSALGFCGMRHSGEGPFLSIGEIESLMWQELERRTESH